MRAAATTPTGPHPQDITVSGARYFTGLSNSSHWPLVLWPVPCSALQGGEKERIRVQQYADTSQLRPVSLVMLYVKDIHSLEEKQNSVLEFLLIKIKNTTEVYKCPSAQ